MSDQGTSVTLIFYKVGQDWWREPALNLIAAAAQFSSYTHVELAIGETAGSNGQMANVVRIFNDPHGVELCERTGRNPQYTYLSIGCSRAAEQRMLAFARAQIGKPFSNMGMARSLLFPRKTSHESFFCAELVAAVLKAGGLMSADSNPGAATPHSLYKLYSKQAAATANPFTLRQVGGPTGAGLLKGLTGLAPPGTQPTAEREGLLSTNGLGHGFVTPAPLGLNLAAPAPQHSRHALGGSARRHSDSPPRASFKVMSHGCAQLSSASAGITLSLSSLRG